MSTFEEFDGHFPTEVSKSLERYVTSTVLKDSRYLFYRTVLGAQFAYCTHCNKQHSRTNAEEKLKHKQDNKVQCPHCKSMCHVRHAGMSRKYMKDKAVFVWYEKSKVNSKAITARVIEVYRDYSGHYTNVKTMFNCSHMYLFEPGKSTYYNWNGKWIKRSTVFSAFDKHFSGSSFWGIGWNKFRSIANIRWAVRGTPFQYSTWEHFTIYRNPDYVTDMVEFFDLAARYPCVEYLTKLGFEKVVWAKLYKNETHRAINWRGKTIEKVLKLSKEKIQEIRKSGLSLEPNELRYYQDQINAGNNISVIDAQILSKIDNDLFKSHLEELYPLAPKDQLLSYLLKQFKRGQRDSISGVFYDYRDYLRQCKELRISLREERYLFPNDLHKEHQKLTKRIKLKENRHLNKLIAGRLTELDELCFERNGLMTRPIASLKELFDEAAALNHCVGSYANQYAKGKTNLFVVRKLDSPNTPYFTLEFTKDNIRQCRGLKNCDMTPDVNEFIEAFKKEKLSRRSKKRKINRSERQEVAV